MTSQPPQLRIKMNWTVFIIGIIISCIGLYCMFSPVNETEYYGSYRATVPTYPYFTLGIILDFVGLMVIVASFFTGHEN